MEHQLGDVLAQVDPRNGGAPVARRGAGLRYTTRAGRRRLWWLRRSAFERSAGTTVAWRFGFLAPSAAGIRRVQTVKVYFVKPLTSSSALVDSSNLYHVH